jgi:Gaa1-like, GPI transamidase component
MTCSCLDYSLWAKDLAFVITDGYLDGMHAWISTYHGYKQDSAIFSTFLSSTSVPTENHKIWMPKLYK